MNKTAIATKKKLSVVMMAYNQGRFIDEAIQSVIRQDKPFSWELLIGDDASGDNTEEKVSKWIKEYPENIFYYKYEKNIGLHKNYQYLIEKSIGEFVALLEADDYWIDTNKTRLQVELMDSDKEIAFSFTNADTVDVNGMLLKQDIFHLPCVFDLDFYVSNYLNPPNNTIVFRKSCEPAVYPEWFFSIRQWDTALHYLRGLNGKIGFVAVKGLAWRRHKNATSFSEQFEGLGRYKDWLVLFREMEQIMPEHLKKYFKGKYPAYENLAIVFLRDKKYAQFIRYSFLMLVDILFLFPKRPLKVCRSYLWKVRHIKKYRSDKKLLR